MKNESSKKLGIVLVAALFLSGCAALTWTYPEAHRFPNVKVQFVNGQTGWVVGPRLYRTQDGGSSWKIVRPEGPGTIVTEIGNWEEKRIQFVDERVGFILERKRVIYKTKDGGETWNSIASPEVTDETEKFETLFFVSQTKGWLFGKNIYRTDDGALTWKRVGAAPVDDVTRDGLDPAIWFLNDQAGVLVKKYGDVYRTEDGGANWRRVWSANNFLTDVHFVNDKHGWLIGDKGFIGRTADGGSTWEKVTVPTSVQLNALYFLDEKKGWAVGRDSAIIYTNDGGTTWLIAQVPTKAPLASVFFTDEKRGFAVGGEHFDEWDSVNRPTNLILESLDGGQTWAPRDH